MNAYLNATFYNARFVRESTAELHARLQWHVSEGTMAAAEGIELDWRGGDQGMPDQGYGNCPASGKGTLKHL